MHRMDQSSIRGGDFSLYKSAPFYLVAHAFPFHQMLKAVFPWLPEGELPKTSCLAGLEQRGIDLTGIKLLCSRAAVSKGCLAAVL